MPTGILEEGSLTVYRRTLIAADGSLDVEVRKVRNALARRWFVRPGGIKARCPKAASGDGLEQRSSHEIGLKGEGGERTVPGVYFLSAELGYGTVAREIALLDQDPNNGLSHARPQPDSRSIFDPPSMSC